MTRMPSHRPTGDADSPASPPARREGGAIQYFTIIARNYLAHARVLAASLARHNPGTRLQVLVLDDRDKRIAPDPSFDIIRPSDLPFDPPSEFHTMAAIYDVTELATAVKPWVFEHLFARGAPVVVYLDPDIEVFGSLGELEPLARERGMVLTPHVTEPLPRDGMHPDELDLLAAGVYNLGFLALSARTAAEFLPWWRERLRRDCLDAVRDAIFVDQRWIDFAPALFDPAILKDPGYNVAYWNLPHRDLTRDGERILVNGAPLRFFHFSGFSPRTPHLLSRHQHGAIRVRLSESPLLAEICRGYASALERAGVDACSGWAYGFGRSADGLPLDARTRRVLRRSYLDDEAKGVAPPFPDPFSREGAEDVVRRLLRPSQHAPGVPAFLFELWSDRVDLRVAFPHIDSVDAPRFLAWVHASGVKEYGIPAQLVPPPQRDALTAAARAPRLAPGVNVFGYAFAESGTGQVVRSVVAALAAEGIPYAVVPFTLTVSRQQREFTDLGSATPAFDTNLFCVNADPTPIFFERMQGKLPQGARNIGLWAWEVEELPASMAASERFLDEVWGISSFTAKALQRALAKPVRAFPLPVVVPPVRRRARAELGMPEGFLFLFCFDYDSVFERKNPLAVVAAFREAFHDRSDVALLIKTNNAARHAADDERLRLAASGCPNVTIRDGYVTTDDYFSMLDACDCYVSLHRAEGFGLTVAEAMALGKPVIATAYSATSEFANESNSFPVRARMRRVGDGAAPYPPDARWAEPDVSDAARQMRRVVADPAGAAKVGARARADIETRHSPAARGPLLRRLLEESRAARATAPAAPEQPPATFAADPFEGDAGAAEALLGAPRSDLPARFGWLAGPLRRLVLRCIRIFWIQQRAIDNALLAAMRSLRRESKRESAENAAAVEKRLARETARMREELRALATAVRDLRREAGRPGAHVAGRKPGSVRDADERDDSN